MKFRLIFCIEGFAYGLELGFMDSIAVSLIASARCSDNESFIANATVDTMACANTVSDRAEIALSTCQSAPSSSQTDDRHSINDNTFTSGDDEAGADATISFRQLTDVGDGTKSSCNRRTLKRCFEIAARAKAVPNQNIDSFDFDTEVVHLRGLYKLSGTLVGPFRPAKKLQNDTIAAAIPNLSNEW